MRMVDQDIQPGQRWVSDAEPELGLGVVMSAGNGRVSILFPAADDRREYALESAPVRRVAFEVGDHLKTHDGISGSIEEVKEEIKEQLDEIPTKDELKKLTKAKLEEFGRDLGIELDKRKTKDNMIQDRTDKLGK